MTAAGAPPTGCSRTAAGFHPLAALAAAAAVFLPAAAWTNPLWLGILLAASLAALAAAAGPRRCGKTLSVALPAAVLFALVNALVARAGDTVLVSPRVLFLPFPLRLEPLVFGLSSGLRIALAIAAFSLAEALADADGAFALCSRFAPKTALAVSLAVLAIPRMRRDLGRIRSVMAVRGAALDARNLFARINASRPILHALLVSSLEGAWDTAVALQTRGWGCGARSAAPAPPWRRADRILASGAALSLAVSGAGLALGKSAFVFYPRLGRLCIAADLPWLFAAAAALPAAVALAGRAAR
jgi:energy-coupling factor transport system permease protein